VGRSQPTGPGTLLLCIKTCARSRHAPGGEETEHEDLVLRLGPGRSVKDFRRLRVKSQDGRSALSSPTLVRPFISAAAADSML
jgi:hypothetical protein